MEIIMPKFNYKPNFIPVSTDFIENYMPKANGAYVKVYLLSLHLSMSKGEMTTAQMASILNLIESDVVNALDYWNKEGVLVYSNDNVLFKGAEEVSANNYTDDNNDSVSKNLYHKFQMKYHLIKCLQTFVLYHRKYSENHLKIKI